VNAKLCSYTWIAWNQPKRPFENCTRPMPPRRYREGTEKSAQPSTRSSFGRPGKFSQPPVPPVYPARIKNVSPERGLELPLNCGAKVFHFVILSALLVSGRVVFAGQNAQYRRERAWPNRLSTCSKPGPGRCHSRKLSQSHSTDASLVNARLSLDPAGPRWVIRGRSAKDAGRIIMDPRPRELCRRRSGDPVLR
jgi:hypothetical protein